MGEMTDKAKAAGNKLAGSYWSPIVGCILGEIVGR